MLSDVAGLCAAKQSRLSIHPSRSRCGKDRHARRGDFILNSSGLVEEGCALGVRIVPALPLKLLAGPGGHGHGDGRDEEHRHDDEGKDPLQGNNLAEELRDANRSGQDAEVEPHGVVLGLLVLICQEWQFTNLVGHNEETTVDQDTPDEDVAKDAGNEVGGVGNHQSTIPVDSHKGPCQRARDDRQVNEARVGVVAEVERAQVKEVEDQKQLSPVEVRTDKEHDEGEVEEVVENKVAANARGGVHDVGVGGEEVANVTALEDEEHDPVDGGDYGVHGESAGVERVLVPDTLADSEAILGRVDGIVDGHDDGQGPGEKGEDLVDGHRGRGVRLALGEGVV